MTAKHFITRHPGESRDLDAKYTGNANFRRLLFAMRGGWVYIMTNKPGGVLISGLPPISYSGSLSIGRAPARNSAANNLRRLVLAEPYPTIDEAIAREKAMKEWQRAWKVELIERANPDWRDLWASING